MINNVDFEVMHMLGQAKRYIDDAYEMLKKGNGLETRDTPDTCSAKWNTHSLMVCPSCGKVAGWNSYFASYICPVCGWKGDTNQE